MLLGESAALPSTSSRNTGSKSPLARPSKYRRASSRCLGCRAPLIAGHDPQRERRRSSGHIAHPQLPNRHRTHAWRPAFAPGRSRCGSHGTRHRADSERGRGTPRVRSPALRGLVLLRGLSAFLRCHAVRCGRHPRVSSFAGAVQMGRRPLHGLRCSVLKLSRRQPCPPSPAGLARTSCARVDNALVSTRLETARLMVSEPSRRRGR